MECSVDGLAGRWTHHHRQKDILLENIKAMFCKCSIFILRVEDYLSYKTITFQKVSSEAQVKNFFYFIEKLCSSLKIFKFLSVRSYHAFQSQPILCSVLDVKELFA